MDINNSDDRIKDFKTIDLQKIGDIVTGLTNEGGSGITEDEGIVCFLLKDKRIDNICISRLSPLQLINLLDCMKEMATRLGKSMINKVKEAEDKLDNG